VVECRPGWVEPYPALADRFGHCLPKQVATGRSPSVTNRRYSGIVRSRGTVEGVIEGRTGESIIPSSVCDKCVRRKNERETVKAKAEFFILKLLTSTPASDCLRK